MSARKGRGGDIIVAAKCDANLPNLIWAGASLARASGCALRLVHVVSAEYPTYAELYQGARDHAPSCTEKPTTEMSFDRDAAWASPSALDTAAARLSQIADSCALSGMTVHTSVLVGDFPGTLIEYASGLGASLIVAGAAQRSPGLLKSKLRHTYRLMARSGVPVIIQPDVAAPLVFGERPLRLLLADDLTLNSVSAITAAGELVGLLGQPADVLHLHVEPLPTAAFAVSPNHELEVWPGLSVKDRLVNDHHDHLLSRLRARARPLRKAVEAMGGVYATQLWHGNVREEINRAAEVHAPDISIFGRHQFVHRQPLALGQMSFAAMLGVAGAVLIAPA